ncbi:MAG: hypothetical protein KDC38_12730 [Planctomycetes bacterium]|nr:hypothetical protein [Planctomycetota bacterium]
MADTPTHVIWIEPRRVHAWGSIGGRPTLCEQPLAYCRLPNGVALSGDDWAVLEDQDQLYVVGDDAELIARQVPGAPPALYPLSAPRVDDLPWVAWRAMSQIVRSVLRLSADNSAPTRLLALVPGACRAASNLWLHALPETLLADLHPGYRVVSAPRLLLPEAGTDTLRWSWLVTEDGVSIGTEFRTVYRESYVASDPTPSSESLARTLLIERALSRSLELSRPAWAVSTAPSIRLALVATHDPDRELESTLARGITKLGLGPRLRAESFAMSSLLARAIASTPVDAA